MNSAIRPRFRVWQPFTFAGVAAYSQAEARHIWVTQGISASCVAAAVIWLFANGWDPVIRNLISALPDDSSLVEGRLRWPDSAEDVFAANSFLSITVSLTSRPWAGQGADVQCKFGETHLRWRSLLGSMSLPYPKWTLPVNRSTLEPWWGAWFPLIAALLGLSTCALLLALWAFLGFLYSFPLRAIAFFADRILSPEASRRVATASLMPGAFLMTLALTAYGTQHLGLIQLLAVTALHLAVGWIYLIATPFRLERIDLADSVRTRPDNPFRHHPKKSN